MDSSDMILQIFDFIKVYTFLLLTLFYQYLDYSK